jgi:nicotinamidase/pyrazinamidase
MPLDFSSCALVEIDVQNDFCPGGALAVERGDEVIAPLNKIARFFSDKGSPVIASADWHPKGHYSFASSHPGKKSGDILEGGQALWADHCVQGSYGAAFHKKLDLNPVSLIVRKGFRKNLDSYSVFFENDKKTPTGLAGFLKGLSISAVVLGGLALDYCVLYSALDAARAGFKTTVIKNAARGIDFPSGSIAEAYKCMENSGVTLVNMEDLL